IRCFEDPDVVHVMGPVDPVRDHDIVTGELALADLAVVERRLEKARKTARAGDKDAQAELGVLERVIAELDAGRGAREAGESDEAIAFLRRLGLLTAKPILYAANVHGDDLASGRCRRLEQLRAAGAPGGRSSMPVTSTRAPALQGARGGPSSCAPPCRRTTRRRRWCRSPPGSRRSSRTCRQGSAGTTSQPRESPSRGSIGSSTR